MPIQSLAELVLIIKVLDQLRWPTKCLSGFGCFQEVLPAPSINAVAVADNPDDFRPFNLSWHACKVIVSEILLSLAKCKLYIFLDMISSIGVAI